MHFHLSICDPYINYQPWLPIRFHLSTCDPYSNYQPWLPMHFHLSTCDPYSNYQFRQLRVYPYKSQFYYIKVGFKGVKII